jgi:peptide/nickel transport system ATP-binding protein
VERAPANALYSAPRHPYTLGLLNSSPPLHGQRRELEGIPGSPPDLAEVIVGCSFRARCPFALAKCATDTPALVPVDDGARVVACWLHEKNADVSVPESLAKSVSMTPSPTSRHASTPLSPQGEMS